MKALRNYIKSLNTPPGPPTQQGIYASPEWTGQPYPSIDWEAITQNQEPPEGWPRPPKFNEPGDVPGPPVQFGDPITPETVEAGFNYIDNGVPELNIYYYHPDHLGSSSHITDINGNLSQHTEFMAFGEILFDEHSVSVTQPYLFNGKELDSETNLTYYGARYLDMKTSLWLNVDPLVEQTFEAYTYVGNNPLRYIDPTGMEAEDIIIGKSLTDNFTTNKAFNTFAKTKEGIAFLSDYAKKGNVIAGHTYMEDGKYHKQGIDLVFEGKDIGGSTRGYTEASMNRDRANIIFTINTNSKVGSQDGNTYDMGVLGQPYSQAGTDIAVKGILSRTITIFHETFIHGYSRTKDFLDDKLFNNSNIDNSIKKSYSTYKKHWDHIQIQIGSDKGSQLFNTKGLNGIKSANSRWSSGKHYNNSQMGDMMWRFSGSWKK